MPARLPLADRSGKPDFYRSMRNLALLLLACLGATVHAQVPCDVSVVVTSPTCPDDTDGSIAVVPNAPGLYTYIWPQQPNLSDSIATGLATGTYTVIVSDTSGCYSEIDTTVVPPVVQPLGSFTSTNITCAGLNDGSLTFTVNPGPYTWEWVDDPTNTNATRTNLAPGQYVVVVNGGICPSWIFAELGDPAVTIGGHTTYCPADPPVVSADNWWGFQPDVWIWSTGDTTASFQAPIGLQGPVSVIATDTSINCTSTAEVVFTMLQPPTVSYTVPDTLCLRAPGTGILISSNADSLVWHWGDNGFSNEAFPTITFDQSGWQPVNLQGYDSLACGSAPQLDSVYVIPRFPALFTAEQLPCSPGIEVKLNSQSDSCAFFAGGNLVLNQCRGTYHVDLHYYNEYDFTFYSTRPDHCDDTTTVHMDVRTPPTAFLPNAFTPNNDGINDTWPGLLDIPDLKYQVEIFDRWGHSVWASANTEDKWDGGGLPMGVYVYHIRMTDPCNPSSDLKRNGFISLIR